MRPLTRSCLLLPLLGRLFLLALPFLLGICLRSRWSPPFPLPALALIPLSLAKVRLSLTLTLSSLMIWYSGQTALFLLARAAPTFMPTALSVAPRPLFPFQQAQYAQVSPLKPAPFCTLFAGLGSTNKSAISLLFSSYLTLLHLPRCLWQIWQELSFLSSCSIRLQWVPGHPFFPGNDAADELARRGAPSAIPCSLSPLISDRRRTVSLKYFDTQVPSTSTEELVLPLVVVVIQFLSGVFPLAEMAGFTPFLLQFLALRPSTYLVSEHPPSSNQSSLSPLPLASSRSFSVSSMLQWTQPSLRFLSL